MALERMNPGELAPPSGPFVNAVRAGKLLFISGQVAYGPDGEIVGVGDPEAQAVQVMENVGASLRAAGASFADVTKVTVFLTDMAHRAAVAGVRERYFAGANPASTLVQVGALVHPDLLLEIEAIAVLPD
jgi:2-iminobutanoate/2-iminopropanoate deaminase